MMVESTPSVEVDTNESLLSDYMKKVTVWDYYSMTKENYLSLPRTNQEKMIREYYSEMVKRSSDGKIVFICFLCMPSRPNNKKIFDALKGPLTEMKTWSELREIYLRLKGS